MALGIIDVGSKKKGYLVFENPFLLGEILVSQCVETPARIELFQMVNVLQ